MKLERCELGHYFDSEKYGKCPECSNMSKVSKNMINENDSSKNKIHTRGKTISIYNNYGKKADNSVPTSNEETTLISENRIANSETLHNGETVGVSPLLKQHKSNLSKKGFKNFFGIKKGSEVLNRESDNSENAETQPFKEERICETTNDKNNDEKCESAPSSLAQEVAAVQHTYQSDSNKTMAYYNFGSTEPVVGWLVCVKGVYAGESFNLKSGQNYIGRSLAMDIVLKDEQSVSREKHAMIMFDPKKATFFISPGQSSGITYLNDEALLQPASLKAYDFIELGDALLVFMPFCNKDFKWDDYLK